MVKIETYDIVALRLDRMTEAPDLRGFELKVVSSHLPPDEARRIIDSSIPEELQHKDFHRIVAEGSHLYLLYKDDRWVHYNFVGTNVPASAMHVPGPGEPISFDSWTIDGLRGQRLFPLSLSLMGWHAKQAGHERLYGSVALWNRASAKATSFVGLEIIGRFTCWYLPRLVLRIEHGRRGPGRYRIWSSRAWFDTSPRHALLPHPEREAAPSS